MHELRTLRRAGSGALRLLVELLPQEWDPRSPEHTVSIVFADVSDYSDFVAQSGDDAAVDVLDALNRTVTHVLAGRRGARVVKRLGDGLMIAARHAHDGPAIAAGLVEGFADEAQAGGWPLRLRAGVHRGEVRRQGDDYVGYHVNVAARVTDAAPPGRALATLQAVDGLDLAAVGVEARPAGRLHAKGVHEPLVLRSVRSADGVARRAAS